MTMIELLVVVAVVGILTALVAPAIGSMISALNLNRGATIVAGKLNEARQTAVTRTRRIEVRFYLIPDGSVEAYRAIRWFLIEEDGDLHAISKVAELPDGIVISKKSEFFSIPQAAGLSSVGEVPGQGALPYRAFQFKRDGSTDLAPEETWAVTILPERQDGDSLPPNFNTITIDPVSGRLETFQP